MFTFAFGVVVRFVAVAVVFSFPLCWGRCGLSFAAPSCRRLVVMPAGRSCSRRSCQWATLSPPKLPMSNLISSQAATWNWWGDARESGHRDDSSLLRSSNNRRWPSPTRFRNERCLQPRRGTDDVDGALSSEVRGYPAATSRCLDDVHRCNEDENLHDSKPFSRWYKFRM